MTAPSPAHPAAAALDTNPRTQLDNALRHLRHAGRCVTLALRSLDDHQAAAVAVAAEIHVAARATDDLIDRLNGVGEASR
jgi:hypothetical protein